MKPFNKTQTKVIFLLVFIAIVYTIALEIMFRSVKSNYRTITPDIAETLSNLPVDTLFSHIMTMTVGLSLFFLVFAYIVLHQFIIKPLQDINAQLEHAESEEIFLHSDAEGEIGNLVRNFNQRTKRLLEAKARENKEYELRIAQEEMLIQQSKMALMGEMMDSVAHQWKQPLNAISLYVELIRSDFEEGKVDKAYIETFRQNIHIQLDHMINTLDEFRSFFRPEKEKRKFELVGVVKSALFLAKDDILKHHILTDVVQHDNIVIDGYPNEFKHLILNVISNAKDVFIERDIKPRRLIFKIYSKSDGDYLEIEDNAGGIPEEMLDKIFEPNFTTKAQKGGTGIGLYMSRRIAQKHHAEFFAKNCNDGACFIVRFPKNDTK